MYANPIDLSQAFNDAADAPGAVTKINGRIH